MRPTTTITTSGTPHLVWVTYGYQPLPAPTPTPMWNPTCVVTVNMGAPPPLVTTTTGQLHDPDMMRGTERKQWGQGVGQHAHPLETVHFLYTYYIILTQFCRQLPAVTDEDGQPSPPYSCCSFAVHLLRWGWVSPSMVATGQHNDPKRHAQVTGQGVGCHAPPQYWLIGAVYKVHLFFFF